MSTKIQQGTRKSSWKLYPYKNSCLRIKIICNLASQTCLQEIKGSGALSSRSALCSEKMEKMVKACAKGSFWQRLWWSISLFLPETGFILFFFFHCQPGPLLSPSVFSLATSCLSSWIPLLSTILNDNGYPLLNTHPVLSATHTTSYSIFSKALVRWVLWLSPSPLNR